MGRIPMTMALRYIQRQGVYHYFRFPGMKNVRIDGLPGSPEYLAHYERLLVHVRPMPVIEPPPAPVEYLPGSIGWVIKQFMVDKKFTRKAAGTQGTYRRVLDLIKREIGGCDIADMRRSHVKRLTADIAANHGDSVADMAMTLTSRLWKFARDLPDCEISDDAMNPVNDIERRYQVEKPHLPWPAHVLAKFLDGADARLRLAVVLLVEVGQRGGDACAMRWDDIDGKNVLHIVQQKRGAVVAFPIDTCPILRDTLAAAPRTGDRIIGIEANSVSKKITKRLRKIGHGDRYTMHGLRVTAATIAAQAGATNPELLAKFGWANSKQADHYTRNADKAKLVENLQQKIRAAKEAA
jgi:integrase